MYKWHRLLQILHRLFATIYYYYYYSHTHVWEAFGILFFTKRYYYYLIYYNFDLPSGPVYSVPFRGSFS